MKRKSDNLAYKMIKRIIKYQDCNTAIKFMTRRDYSNYAKYNNLEGGLYDLNDIEWDATIDWAIINDYINIVPFRYTDEDAQYIKSLLEATEKSAKTNVFEDSNFVIAAHALYNLKIKRIKKK